MAAKPKADILLAEVDALETILSCMKIEDICGAFDPIPQKIGNRGL